MMGDVFAALQVVIAFAFVLLLLGLMIGLFELRFRIVDPLQSFGSPSVAILLCYYLIILPVIAFAFVVSRRYYRIISLALFAVSAFSLAIAMPAAL